MLVVNTDAKQQNGACWKKLVLSDREECRVSGIDEVVSSGNTIPPWLVAQSLEIRKIIQIAFHASVFKYSVNVVCLCPCIQQ